MNVLLVIVCTIVIKTPAPGYWANQQAFETVLGNTPRVLFASLSAFIIGDLVNDKVFAKMKSKYVNSHKRFGIRAFLSSFLGELTDSCIFIPLAFLGQMPVKTLIIMGICQVSIKTLYEIIILPITTILVQKVSNYERKNG